MRALLRAAIVALAGAGGAGVPAARLVGRPRLADARGDALPGLHGGLAVSGDRSPRALAALTAFLLPLGTVGIGGVVTLGLYLVTFGRRALPGEGRLVAAALPLALAPVAATLVFAEQAGVAPTRTALVGFLATQAFDLGWHHASVAVSVTLVAALGLVPVRRAAGAEDGAPG